MATLSAELALCAPCAHCGLDAPVAVWGEDASAIYCCAGCATAAEIIRQSGLEAYYALPLTAERRPRRVVPTGRSYAEFDHEAFQSVHVTLGLDGIARIQLYLEGVHCASCVWLVERVPLIVSGTLSAELDVTRGVARVAWDPAATTLSEIARALDALGYRPHAFRGVRADDARRAEERAMLTRIGVAGALAGNVMMIALALYSGMFTGMEREFERYFRWISWALITPALLWPGRVFFTSAWRALRAGGVHMDVPIALALGLGYAQGALNTWRDAGPVYFDAVGTLIFLLLVGRYLQHRAQRGAADSAALLGALAPATARVVEGDVVREVPSEAVLPEMLLEVRAGDTLAADGVVEQGTSALDLALLTGESHPVRVAAGDQVFAGTLNLSSTMRVRVSETGSESRLGRLLRGVEDAARERPPVVLLADRMASGFIVVVLLLAALTAAIWWSSDPLRAVDHAIALLVITCPCALAMATPLTFTVAIGRAASRGILIKGGHALETLAGRGTLILDKTGTLTQGRHALESWEVIGPEWSELPAAILALEAHSRHTIASAFGEAWTLVEPAEASDAHETFGGGVEGFVDGRHVLVGAPHWVLQRASAPVWLEPLSSRLTPVFVAVDGVIQARAGFGDPLRAGSKEAVRELVRAGWNVRLLSGDAPSVVSAVAAELGLPARAAEGGASPERKRAVVRAARSEGAVVMVGDGVNDAAAISEATVGVAVQGGAEAALASADVYLSGDGIGALRELLEGARRTTRIIERNIALALGYNVVGVALAMTGVIDPLFAAILMPLSSVTVVLGAWRGRTFTRSAA